MYIILNWQWRFINLIFLYNIYIRQKFKWYLRFLNLFQLELKKPLPDEKQGAAFRVNIKNTEEY